MINISTQINIINEDEASLKEIDNTLKDSFPKKINKVLLIRPPDVDVLQFNYEAGQRKRHSNYPPYGLLVLATNLKNIGVKTACVDLHLEVLKECFTSKTKDTFDFENIWKKKLEKEISAFKPDLIAVTCMFTMTHKSFVSVTNRASQSGIPVIVGGVHVTNDTDFVLDFLPMVNFAFLQEADVSLINFIEVINGKKNKSDLAQLIVVTKKNAVIKRVRIDKSARPKPEQLDIIPSYELVDLPAYSKYGIMGSAHFMKEDNAKFATVLANRGCRAKCTFCSVRGFNGDSVRSRSVKSVVDEIELLRDKYGIEHIMWLDDDLLYDHSRAINLFNEMFRRNLGITWDAGNGVLASSCVPDVISAAHASGCISLTIGMESGNRAILKKIRKPASPETLLRAAEVLKQFPSIFVRVFLMLGFPGETVRAIRDTIELATQMNLDWHTITKLQGLPSTEIYKDLSELGKTKKGADTRYSLNTYGHNRKEDPLLNIDAITPESLLDSMDSNSIPSDEELDSLWFIMNYMVNFRRIFQVKTENKQRQILTFTKHISEIVAPEHAFSLYFQSYLENRLGIKSQSNMHSRLKSQLEASPTWAYWFKTFGLSASHLVNNDYSSVEIN